MWNRAEKAYNDDTDHTPEKDTPMQGPVVGMEEESSDIEEEPKTIPHLEEDRVDRLMVELNQSLTSVPAKHDLDDIFDSYHNLMLKDG